MLDDLDKELEELGGKDSKWAAMFGDLMGEDDMMGDYAGMKLGDMPDGIKGSSANLLEKEKEKEKDESIGNGGLRGRFGTSVGGPGAGSGIEENMAGFGDKDRLLI